MDILSNDIKEKLKGDMEREIPKVLEDLGSFISIPSVSSNKQEVDRALDYILDLGKNMGFEARSCCNHQVGVIEYGEGPETLGILGHVDVVPPGDSKNWESDPFTMDIRAGKAFGRGTIDDKGPVMLCLHAMKVLKDSGIPVKKKIQLILGTQEEVEWVDMKAYVKEEKLPDYGFTPDGEYPLCNIEKGIVDVDLCYELTDEDLAPEAGKVKLIGVDAGIMPNAVPGTAKAVAVSVVEDGTILEKQLEAKGKAVHSSMPARGENAVYLLAERCKEEGCSGKLMDILYSLKENFESIYGEEIGLMSKSEYYRGEFVHRNTFAVTMLKMEGKKLMAHVNVRFAYGTEARDICAKLEAFAERQGGWLEIKEEMPAVYVSIEKPFIRCMIEAYEEATGRKHENTIAYGGSYAKAMPNVVSFGPLFPDEEDTCHEDNEYYDLESMRENALITILTLAKICLTEESLN